MRFLRRGLTTTADGPVASTSPTPDTGCSNSADPTTGLCPHPEPLPCRTPIGTDCDDTTAVIRSGQGPDSAPQPNGSRP